MFNGNPIRDVITADEELGHIERYIRDGNGRLLLGADGNPATEILTGRVGIFFL